MESLAVLVALIALAIPVALVGLAVAVLRLKARLARLEDRVLTLARREVPDETAGTAARAVRHRQGPMAESAGAGAPPGDTAGPDLPAIADKAGRTPPEPPLTPPAAGPWSGVHPAAPVTSAAPAVAPSVRFPAFGRWLAANWVYAVSALSLALAGIFFVQYGMEKGLLPPGLRVIAAILFGLALIGAGEWLRRRGGDAGSGDEGSGDAGGGDAGVGATAYLPSTFSGAGLVSIFAGILAARQLYALIGSETAFAGLLATAVLAVVLGWRHGPFLAAVGLIGAAAAPFLVGGDSPTPTWLYGYFALIAGVGLAIDTIRRWAWVSVLALALGYGGGWLVLAGTGGAGWAALMLVALVVLAVLVPARGLMPDHAGAMLSEALWRRRRGGQGGVAAAAGFATRLAAGAVAATALGLTLLPAVTGGESALALLGLAALALALCLWSRLAPALADLTLMPAAGFLARLGFEGADRWPLARDFAARATALRAPETAAPMTAALVLGLAVVITLAAARASGLAADRLRPFWAAGAALVAPLAALVLELFWAPSAVLGAYPWALHVIALAALMAALAGGFARADGCDLRRAAYAALAALSLIALALFVITTRGALTLALAVLVVVAALLDRRFRLPEMGLFIQAAAIAISWRLIVDPGLGWAVEDAALWEVIASFGGATAAMAAGLVILRGLARRATEVVLQSALAGYGALFANVLVTRWLTAGGGQEDRFLSHWGLSLNAMPWLVLMLVQLYRLQRGGSLRWLRWGLALLGGGLGLGGLALAVAPANPLFGLGGGQARLVLGPPMIDTLLLAYAVPGLVLLAALTRLGHLGRFWRGGLGAIGAALVALYGALEIRHLWRGADIVLPALSQGELYSYTLALMALGSGLLYQAIARRAPGLRRIAMTVIALTVAKVFLIDAAGLSGLTRVFSFLALGLSLAALAWLNRWAAGRAAPAP